MYLSARAECPLCSVEAVAFRFEDMEDRDTFALCTGMFVDQRRQAPARRMERARARPWGGRAAAHIMPARL